MLPAKFPESNRVFKGPEGGKILDLPVSQDSEEIVSCWKMSFRERISAMVFGTVWVNVLGAGHPPIGLLAHAYYYQRKGLFSRCGHCFGNGFKPGSRSYKGADSNMQVACPYCKGDGFNWFGRLVASIRLAWFRFDASFFFYRFKSKAQYGFSKSEHGTCTHYGLGLFGLSIAKKNDAEVKNG